MARNKYPEETVERILDVSFKLFLEKGYDKTSIQDIIDNLGGLSKGAIYHHFKSKEAILEAVYNRLDSGIAAEMTTILRDSSRSGAEKLRQMFLDSLRDEGSQRFLASMPNLLDNPQLLAIHMKTAIQNVVPNFILPVIREGIADGSIETDSPLELSNLLILLANVWLNPLIYPNTEEKLEKKVRMFGQIMQALGLHLGDAPLFEGLTAVNQRREALHIGPDTP